MNNKWTYQGFGMLRLYVGGDMRLHVWVPELAVENVSVIHDHPWDFESVVIAGCVKNVIYRELPHGIATHKRQRIRCGTGGGPLGDGEPVVLGIDSVCWHHAGTKYWQRAEELHESIPTSGTVTLIKRKPRVDPDHAVVYHHVSTSWVSAEPRPATDAELAHALHAASEGIALALETAARGWF